MKLAAAAGLHDDTVIPPLALPPPALPFRHYGHTYLKNKTLLSIKMGTSTSVGLRRTSTHTPELVSGDHDRRTQCVHLGSYARDFVRFLRVAGNVPAIAAQNFILLTGFLYARPVSWCAW
jgi:hypothetical protein